jgi:hypothetical protein
MNVCSTAAKERKKKNISRIRGKGQKTYECSRKE